MLAKGRSCPKLLLPLFLLSMLLTVSAAEAQTATMDVVYGKRLFAPGDEGCFWRIPAILCLDDGSLLATCDRRKNTEGDLPEDIDVVAIRSTDNGNTWSRPSVVAQGRGRGRGYGDAALVQCVDGTVVCTFAGGNGFWNSSAENPIRTFVCRSSDGGETWSLPEDITSLIWGSQSVNPQCRAYRGSFNASGNGLRLRQGDHRGRILFVAAACRSDVWQADNFAIYSDDNGLTWHVSDLAYSSGDEAKVVELPDGRLLMSVRQNGERGYAYSSDGGQTWHSQGRWHDVVTNACNGDLLLLDTYNGRSKVLLMSLPNSMNREDVSLFVSYDCGTSWSVQRTVQRGPSAYSSMTLLPDGSIAMFAEKLRGDQTELWFRRICIQ